MSCLVGGCNRICSGRYWPAKPEAMVLDAEKICTSCFRVLETEAAKKHLAIGGLAAAAGECKREILAGWRRKGMCRRPGSFWLWAAGRPSRKQRCHLLENVHLVFSRLKNSRLLFFVCQLNFVLLLSAAGAASPGKTKQKR